MSESEQNNAADASVHDVVLLLGRIADALEKIAGHNATTEKGTPIRVARKMAKTSARRWFDYLADDFPDLSYVEQITPAVMQGVRGRFKASTYDHIEEVLELAKQQSQ